MDIDKILEIIQRKVLKGTHLLIEIKEILAGYLCSPYFKDLYLYLSQNRLLSSKPAIRKIEAIAEKYVLLDSLLFKISSDMETAVCSCARNMHRQNYNSVSQKTIHRTSGSYKYIFNYQ